MLAMESTSKSSIAFESIRARGWVGTVESLAFRNVFLHECLSLQDRLPYMHFDIFGLCVWMNYKVRKDGMDS